MTAEQAALLVSDIQRAVHEHFPTDVGFTHLLASLKEAFELEAQKETEGDELVIANAKTGEIRFAYGSSWLKEVEWMDDVVQTPVIVDRRKEDKREGT
jgi:hypothetical protein